MEKSPRYYAPEIDGLRFCAALLVFFHHAPALPRLSVFREYGWVGVDLFLAISAFLLTRLLHLEWQANREIKLGAFFIRRSLRIWPLFFGYVTVMTVLALFRNDTDLGTAFAWWFSFISFTNNLLTALQGYSPIPFTDHLWTIALEEQAYAILPFVLAVFFASGRNYITFAWGAATLIGMLILARIAFLLAGAPHPFIWVLPLRADPFIIGVVLALVLNSRQVKHPYLFLFGGAALISTVALFPSINEAGAFQIFGYTITATGCVLVITGTQVKTKFSALLSIAPLRYLGKISYGFYVYHILCIKISHVLVPHLGLQNAVLIDLTIWLGALALTIALSMMSYAVFEKPFLHLKQKYSLVASRPL